MAEYAVENGWLCEVVNEHTCGTGPDGYYGAHEPGCGLVPIDKVENILRGAQALAAHPPEPEASAPDLTLILDKHLLVYAGYSCLCGWRPGGIEESASVPSHVHRAHVAQVIADTYLPAVVREAEASGQPAGKSEGLDDAGPVPCGSSPRHQSPDLATAWDEGMTAGCVAAGSVRPGQTYRIPDNPYRAEDR